MSFAKLAKLILFSIAGLLLLLIVNLLFFYDPGVGNLPEPIINGYEYNGYDEKIVYQSEEFRPLTIIDSRVDEYRIDGDNLIVARRPRESNTLCRQRFYFRMVDWQAINNGDGCPSN
jgi:hypothetical protein